MKRRRVRFTAAAHRHFDTECSWWIKNRDRRGLFALELDRTLEILATQPYLGPRQPSREFAGLRRYLLRKSRCYIYCTVDTKLLIVRALWGARREGSPKLS